MYETKIAHEARVYTDVQGLENLRGELKTNPNAVKKEVSQQFEAILVQMMLHSMRDANKGFSSDLLTNDQMDFYQDIFDKQLSIVLSEHGMGFAKLIEQNITQNQKNILPDDNQEKPKLSPLPPSTETNNTIHYEAQSEVSIPLAKPFVVSEPKTFNSQEEFLKKLWPAAKNAAGLIGVSPAVLLAQAALETNWGKKVVSSNLNDSTHNLFNIKAGSNWDKKSVPMNSIEQKNGVLVKEKSLFRSYNSYKESFMDYISFLKQNSRYSEALKETADPKKFINALQNAGFATDTAYADKILKIFSNRQFQQWVGKLQ